MLRYYRGGKAYSKADPLFGAPRGNPVMSAKRISGPSANTLLQLHVKLERCSVKGCDEPVYVTKHPNMQTRKRMCAGHFHGKRTGESRIKALLAMPTRNGG